MDPATYPAGAYEVVRADQLLLKTSTGWTLVQVLEEAQAAAFSEEVIRPLDPNNTNTYSYPSPPATTWLSKPGVLTTHVYLVRLDEASKLAELNAQCEALCADVAKLDTLTKELSKARDQLANEKEVMATTEARLQKERADRDGTITTLQQEIEASKKLLTNADANLTKVWDSVGDLHMRQILGNTIPRPGTTKRQTAFERLREEEGL